MTASSESSSSPFSEPVAPGCSLTDLVAACDGLLQPALFKDYGPNGLQVEGRPHLRKIVSGVTASR
ncbi:MAG: putative cyclohydrolase 1 type 2, partial [Pseudomonadota bacterium]